MAVLAEQLVSTAVVKKMPYQKSGRDEINEIAGSPNTLENHSKRLINQ